MKLYWFNFGIYVQAISAVVLLAQNMAALLSVYPRPRPQNLGISPSSSRRCDFQKVPRSLDLATTLRKKNVLKASPSGRNKFQ